MVKKTLYDLMNLCLINAHVLYQLHKGTYLNMADFQLEGTRQLLQVHHMPNLSLKGWKPSKGDNIIRLSERHFPCYVPQKGNLDFKLVLCASTQHSGPGRGENPVICVTDVTKDCVTSCFRIYHTQLVF